MAEPIEALIAGAEQYLSELDDAAFDELVQRVREPADPDNADSKAGRRPSGRNDGLAEAKRRGYIQ